MRPRPASPRTWRDVDFQVHGRPAAGGAQGRALQRLGDQRHVERRRRRQRRRSARRRRRRSSPSRPRSAAARRRPRSSRRARSRPRARRATTPTPSTWPCTMWPPSRSLGAQRQLEVDPRARLELAQRRAAQRLVHHVGAEALPPQRPIAVRQTPLTATSRPRASSRASGDSNARRTPSCVASTAATVPEVCDQPGEHAHHSRRRALISRSSATLLAVERERAQRVGDLLDALALQRVARLAAAEQQRREEQAHLVDLAGVEERAGQVRAALEQDRRSRRASPSAVERAAHARGLVLPRRHDDVGARDLERLDGDARRRAGDDDGERDLGRLGDELASPAAGGRWSRRRRAAAGDARPRRAPSAAGRRRAPCRCRRRRRRRSARQWCASSRDELAGDPLRVAGRASRPCRRASSRT